MQFGTRNAAAPFLGSEETMLRNKPGKSHAWLPSQVAYGVDTTERDPSKRVPFGTYAQETKQVAPKRPDKPVTGQ